jgi:ketosteroid isomerase-like protein
MSDYGKISSVLSGLALALDNQEADAFRNAWTEDAVIEMRLPDGREITVSGRENIIDLARKGDWANPERKIRHFFQTPSISIAGDAAEARFYCKYIAIGPLADVDKIAEYRTQLRREADGAWRIARHAGTQYRTAGSTR